MTACDKVWAPCERLRLVDDSIPLRRARREFAFLKVPHGADGGPPALARRCSRSERCIHLRESDTDRPLS
jgi:hypothetical protein